MFNYDEPVSQPALRPAPRPAAGSGFDLAQMSRLLSRRAGWIAGTALVGALAAVMVGKSLTPKYAASTQLYVDPRELQLVDRELTPRSQDQLQLSMVVDSQVRLITSSNVLEKVVDDLKLQDDAEFGAGSAPGLLARLFGAQPKPHDADDMAAALDALRRHITVRRTDRTFIVDIEAWSRDPARAATLANAVSEAFLAESKDSQAAAARRATVDLSGRLKELQSRLRTAENDLAIYKARNNFVGSQDTQVNDQQLLSGTQRLANAQAATLDAKARFGQIEAIRKNATDPGAIPEALQSPTVAQLRTQFAEARRKQAELLGELGPLHPAIRMADKQVEDLRKAINEELARFAQSAKNDVARAQQLEESLAKALDTQKRQSAELGQAAVKLRELEREVEASRAIYQSFLKRSRETEEQESLNTSNARVVSAATTPQRRSFPPSMSLFAMIGLVLGGLLGAACIILLDRLAWFGVPKPTAQPPRAPERRKEPVVPVIVSAPPIAMPVPAPQPVASVAAAIAEPIYFRLQEQDVLRTLSGIFPLSGAPDIVRLGWPTLQIGAATMRFAAPTLRMIQLAAQQGPVVLAAIGLGCDSGRTIVALNVALGAARTGKRVLLIDADRATHAISNRLNSRRQASSATSEIMSGVTLQKFDGALAAGLAEARRSGHYDLIVLDGPVLPAAAGDAALLAMADGVLVVVPAQHSPSDYLANVTAQLGGAGARIAGVAFSELAAPAEMERRSA